MTALSKHTKRPSSTSRSVVGVGVSSAMGSAGVVMKMEVALRSSWWAWARFRRYAQCVVRIGEPDSDSGVEKEQ